MFAERVRMTKKGALAGETRKRKSSWINDQGGEKTKDGSFHTDI